MSFKKTGKTETLGTIEQPPPDKKREVESTSQNTNKSKENPKK